MLKHPDPEVQLLVEMLEGQRDSAMAQAAALFRQNKELEQKIQQLTPSDPSNSPGNER
jgi:hypothetical protein